MLERVHIEIEIRRMDEKEQTLLTTEHESYVVADRGYYSNYGKSNCIWVAHFEVLTLAFPPLYAIFLRVYL